MVRTSPSLNRLCRWMCYAILVRIRADHRKVQSNSWLRSGGRAISHCHEHTSPQPNDRRGNVENVTLAKLVNGCNCDGRSGNRRTAVGYRVIMINFAAPFFVSAARAEMTRVSAFRNTHVSAGNDKRSLESYNYAGFFFACK